MMRRARQRPGFTLVETIFSSLFIGIAVLAIVNLFPGAYLSIRQSETTLQADIIAKSVIDELRLVQFRVLTPDPPDGRLKESPTEGPGVYDYHEVGQPFDPVTVEGITYTPKVVIYEVPGTQFDFLKGVRVTLSYRRQLVDREIKYETYLHKLIR